MNGVGGAKLHSVVVEKGGLSRHLLFRSAMECANMSYAESIGN